MVTKKSTIPYSVTQSGNLIALVGIIATVLPIIGVNITDKVELEQMVTAILTIIGIVVSWIGRVKAGGITWTGLRK